jgi:hypothetical protein
MIGSTRLPIAKVPVTTRQIACVNAIFGECDISMDPRIALEGRRTFSNVVME